MALGVKYRMEWSDTLGGSEAFKVDIEIEGYASDVIDLGHTEDAFTLSYEEAPVVQGSEAVISFHVDNDTDRTNYDADFYDADYKDAKVKYYVDGTLKWVGWMKPENTTREYDGPVTLYQLSATDGLNDLKDIEYTGFSGIGREPLLQIIKNAINFNGIDDLDFFTQCNIHEVTMLDTEDVFEEANADNDLFYSVEDGESKPDKCYTVLEKAVKSLYCTLAMVDGYWQLSNGQEYNSERTLFNYGNLAASSSNISYDRRVDISAYSRPASSAFELSRRPPIKKLRTTFLNKNLGDNEIGTNPDFETGHADPPTGWTNSGWDAFTTFTLGDGNQVGSCLESNPNADAKYIQASSFALASLDTDNDTLEISFRIKLKQIAWSAGDQFPAIRSALVYDPGGGFESENKAWTQHLTEIDGEFTTMKHTFTLPLGDGTYAIRLYVEPVASNPTSTLQYYFDDLVVVLAQPTNISMDSLHVATAAVSAYEEVEETLHILDGLETNDIGTITIGGALTLSTSWSRYGTSAEGLSLINLYSQQYLNDRQTNHDLLTVELYDQDEAIHYNSILQLGGKTYKWLEMSKNSKSKLISGTLAQVDNSDTTFTLASQTLTSSEGASTSAEGAPSETWLSTLEIVTLFSIAVDGFASTTNPIMIGESEAPDSLLHVKDNTDDAVIHIESSAVNSAVALILENDARRWDVWVDTDESFKISDVTGSTEPFVIETGTTTNTLHLNATGVGIEVDPSYPLDVSGIIRTSTSIYANNVVAAGTGYTSGEWKTAWDDVILSGSYSSPSLTLTQRDAGTVVIDLSGIDETLQEVTDNSFTADGFVSTSRSMTIGANSAPSQELHVIGTDSIILIESTGSTASRVYFDNTGMVGAGYAQIWSQNNDLVFNAGNTEIMRLRSSLDVLISGIVDQKLVIEETSTGANYMQWRANLAARGYIGNDSSVGGVLFTGSAAYDMSIRSEADLHLGGGGNNLQMTLDGSGVGIGTTSPLKLLHINTTGVTNAVFGIGQTGTGQATILMDASNGDFAGTDYLKFWQSNDLVGHIDMVGAHDFILQESGGNVGIGIIPIVKFQVNVATDENVTILTRNSKPELLFMNDAGSASVEARIFANGIHFTSSSLDASSDMYLSGAGLLGIGTTSPTSSAGFTPLLHLKHATNPAIILEDSSTSQQNDIGTGGAGLLISSGGHATASNNTIAFRTSNVNSNFSSTTRLFIKADGNVGIGTTSPTQAKLVVKDSAYSVIGIQTSGSGASTGGAINFLDSAGSADGQILYDDTGWMRFQTLSTTAMTIDASQRVGIGETSPGAKLEVNQTGTGLIFMCTDSGVDRLQLTEAGQLEVDADIIAYKATFSSDPKLKKNKRKFDPWSILNEINGYNFEWIHNNETGTGFMANEVERVMPWSVSVKDAFAEKYGVRDYLALDYTSLIPVIAEGLKQDHRVLINHETRLEKLEKAELIERVKELEYKLEQLAA